jgi:hypothetical protein
MCPTPHQIPARTAQAVFTLELMLRREYESLTGMGNLNSCNIPRIADLAEAWAIRREFELRIARRARDWAARPSASLAA